MIGTIFKIWPGCSPTGRPMKAARGSGASCRQLAHKVVLSGIFLLLRREQSGYLGEKSNVCRGPLSGWPLPAS